MVETSRSELPLLWDIFEEHLNEATWLWEQWEQSLDSALYSLEEVAEDTERRLQAHLAGLVYGGRPVAEALLIPALASDDVAAAAVATWALVQAEDADHQDTVIEVLSAADPLRRAVMGRALSLSPRVDLSRLVPLWNSAAPELRALVLDIFGSREPAWIRDRLALALRSGQAQLVAAGLRAVGRGRERAFLAHVQYALDAPHPEYLNELVSTALALGEKRAWQLCRAVDISDDRGRFVLGMLGASPDGNDRAFVRRKIIEPALRQHVIWALGFSGDAESVEVLIQTLSDEGSARMAGEAISAITGLNISSAFESGDESSATEEVDPDGPPPVIAADAGLPLPSGCAVQEWWSRERARFRPGSRYVRGQPRTVETLRAALRTFPTWRRKCLITELSTLAGDAPMVDASGWARDQLAQLRAR
jgi:uncharacterized protein (TIGR02270 family)